MENTMYREWGPEGKLLKSVFQFVFSIFALVLLVITISEISMALVTATVLVIPLALVGLLF